MVFVPPGDVKVAGRLVPVDGFFIDVDHVTFGEYFDFNEESQEEWRYPKGTRFTGEQRAPAIGMMPFYDALACAASQAKLLPTEAQWRHACAEEPDLVSQDAPEWTRTPYRDPDQAPTGGPDEISSLGVGVQMTVLWCSGQGDNGKPTIKSQGIRFDDAETPQKSPVYWRFVREIPTDEDSVAEVVDGA